MDTLTFASGGTSAQRKCDRHQAGAAGRQGHHGKRQHPDRPDDGLRSPVHPPATEARPVPPGAQGARRARGHHPEHASTTRRLNTPRGTQGGRRELRLVPSGRGPEHTVCSTKCYDLTK